MGTEREISVIVRVLPSNEEVEVSLPLNATAKDVIESLLENGLGQKIDNQGNPITYRLIPKGKHAEISEEETLEHSQLRNGDVLLMTPVFIAG